MSASDFQKDMDDAISDAVGQVCAKHGRLPGPFIGLVRAFDEVGGALVAVYPGEQPIFESLGLANYLSLLMNLAATTAIQTYEG